MSRLQSQMPKIRNCLVLNAPELSAVWESPEPGDAERHIAPATRRRRPVGGKWLILIMMRNLRST